MATIMSSALRFIESLVQDDCQLMAGLLQHFYPCTAYTGMLPKLMATEVCVSSSVTAGLPSVVS